VGALANTARPTFTAPTVLATVLAGDSPQTLIFSLQVTDNEGQVSTNLSTVTITVNAENAAPTSDAGTRAKRSAWMAPGRLTQAAASPLTRGTSMETISMTTPRVSARTSPCRLLAVSQQSACG
jgi:hypothetical protein